MSIRVIKSAKVTVAGFEFLVQFARNYRGIAYGWVSQDGYVTENYPAKVAQYIKTEEVKLNEGRK